MSPFDVAFGLMKNLVAGTLSITFIGLIRAAFWKRSRIMPGWLLGLLFAGAAFVGLLFPVIYSPGVLRDFRNILIALASYFGGIQSGLVAAGIAGAYRFHLGGGGAFGGILGLFSSALAGAFMYKLLTLRIFQASFRRLLMLGLIIFTITFLWSWTLPKEQVLKAIQTFFIPELIFYPLVTALFGTLYQLETDRQTSMEKFRAVFQESQVGIVITSVTRSRIVEANPAFCSMLGYTLPELQNLTLFNILHPEHIPEIERLIRMDEESQPLAFKVEGRFLKKSGEVVWLNVAATDIYSQDGQIQYAIAVMEDITDRKLAEDSLKQYLQRLEILHKTDQAILEADSTENIIQESLRYIREMVPCERASVMLFDVESQEARVLMAEVSGTSRITEGSIVSLKDFPGMEKLNARETILLPDLSALIESSEIFDTLKQEGMVSYAMIPLTVQENLIGTLNLGAILPDAFDKERIEIANEVAHSLAVAIQNMRLMEEIMHHQTELKKMSARILEAQEIERKRISLELHDEMGQALTGISINLAVIEKELKDNTDPIIKVRILETRTLADQCSDQIRNLSFNLRPSILDDLGLEPTLRWYIGGFAKRINVQVDFETSDCEDLQASEVKTLLYRIVQEALNNVAKHAEARKVTVHLSCNETIAKLMIEDDGKGFDAHARVSSQPAGSGLGLIGIRERVTFINGTFNVHSIPGRGTRLEVEIPKHLGDMS
jgi:PAS domain S-box-containing protein